jgi:hypothetical protein
MSPSVSRSPAAVLAACCVILCVGFGVRSGFGLFLQPMSLDNGWGRETFSFAMAIQNLLWGIFGPFAGGIADRYGAGRVVALCGVAYVLGLIVMAFTESALALHVGSGFLIGLALSGSTFAVLLAVISRVTPPEKRSTALGIAVAAGSFGQFAILPITQLMISSIDWRNALLGLAVIAALIVPLAFFVRGKAAPHAGPAQSLGEALREAMRERGFHLLFWGYFVCGFHKAMLTVHLPSYVTDNGLKPHARLSEHAHQRRRPRRLLRRVHRHACAQRLAPRRHHLLRYRRYPRSHGERLSHGIDGGDPWIGRAGDGVRADRDLRRGYLQGGRGFPYHRLRCERPPARARAAHGCARRCPS